MRKGMVWLPNSKEFKELVAKCNSYSQLVKILGYRNCGGGYRMVKKRIRLENIDDSHLKFGRAPTSGLPISFEKLFKADSPHSRGAVKNHLIKHNLIKYECKLCGQPPEWQEEKLTLILDHINGKNNDHRLINLRFLCPNCNSQTSTYGGRNVYWAPRPKTVIDKCANIKTKCPEPELLKKLVWTYPATKLAERFGVSDRMIGKWCEKHDIIKPGRGHWRKVEALSTSSGSIPPAES